MCVPASGIHLYIFFLSRQTRRTNILPVYTWQCLCLLTSGSRLSGVDCLKTMCVKIILWLIHSLTPVGWKKQRILNSLWWMSGILSNFRCRCEDLNTSLTRWAALPPKSNECRSLKKVGHWNKSSPDWKFSCLTVCLVLQKYCELARANTHTNTQTSVHTDPEVTYTYTFAHIMTHSYLYSPGNMEICC